MRKINKFVRVCPIIYAHIPANTRTRGQLLLLLLYVCVYTRGLYYRTEQKEPVVFIRLQLTVDVATNDDQFLRRIRLILTTIIIVKIAAAIRKGDSNGTKTNAPENNHRSLSLEIK